MEHPLKSLTVGSDYLISAEGGHDLLLDPLLCVEGEVHEAPDPVQAHTRVQLLGQLAQQLNGPCQIKLSDIIDTSILGFNNSFYFKSIS